VNKVTPVSLGYPLSIFKINSTLNRRESSKRNYYIISPRVIIKASIVIFVFVRMSVLVCMHACLHVSMTVLKSCASWMIDALECCRSLSVSLSTYIILSVCVRVCVFSIHIIEIAALDAK